MYKKILKIMKNNNEIITPVQLEEKGISRVYLSKMEVYVLIVIDTSV